jgi:hypothetical protein
VVASKGLTLLFWSAITHRGFLEPGGVLLDRALLALALSGAAIVVAPILTRPFGRAGGWLVASLGMIVAGVVDGSLADIDPIVVDRASVVAVGSGLVLGGLVAMVPGGPSGRRASCALGLAVGLPTSPIVLHLAGSVTGSSRWLFIAAPLATTAMVAVSRESGRATPVSEPSDDPAPAAPLSAAVGPALVVSGVAVAVLVADVARQAVIDEIAFSVDGLSTPRREQAVMTVDWIARSATALILGLLLVGYGYRRGRGQVGRWVSTGVGLMALFSPVLQPVSAGTAGRWLLVATVAVAAGGGMALSQAADRSAPWDAIGLALAAIGLLLGLQQVEQELASGRSFRLSAYLATAGCALALGAGLGRLAAHPDERRSIEARAGDAALGLATAVLTASTIAPLWASTVFPQPPGTGLQWQPSALVGVASAIVILFFGLARAVHRVQRDIHAEAAERPR